jgi:hypothetical protein
MQGLPGSVEMIAYKEQAGDRGTFMLTITPGDDLAPNTEGRDWVFVLDLSGSMNGKFQSLFDSRVFALFGQLEYDVTVNVEISLALRYDNKQRKVSSLVPFDARQSVIDLNFDGVFDDPLNPALSTLINDTGIIPDKQETFEEFQPNIVAPS